MSSSPVAQHRPVWLRPKNFLFAFVGLMVLYVLGLRRRIGFAMAICQQRFMSRGIMTGHGCMANHHRSGVDQAFIGQPSLAPISMA